MEKIALIWPLLLLGCSSGVIEIDTVHYDIYEGLIPKVFNYWNEEVGHMRNFNLIISDEESVAVGHCYRERFPSLKLDKVTIYAKTIEQKSTQEVPHETIAYYTLIHELVHVHKTCSDEDHVDDPSHLMYTGVRQAYPEFNLREMFR